MPRSKTFEHVFDEKTLFNIHKLESGGYIGKLLGPVGTGKESYIFYSTDPNGREVAVKVHRHDINAFKRIPTYLRLRGTRSSGFIKRINDWTRYEFAFQSRAFSMGIKTPEPYRVYENLIVMQFIGGDCVSAPQAIRDTDFDINAWYDEIIGSIVTMGKKGLIHGDLSPYNILNYQGKPYIIDFSQAVKLTSLTKGYLLRDIRNINAWFEKLGKSTITDEKDLLGEIDQTL